MNDRPPPLGPQPWDGSATSSTSRCRSPTCATRRITAIACGSSSRRANTSAATNRCAPRCASTSSMRRGAGRPEPLELRRGHDLAHRPLGVARAVLLRAGATGWRADHDLFDGRHARRSRAPARRGRGQGRAPQPQRPVRAGDGGAPEGAEAGDGPHRPDGDRSAPRRLHAGEPVQHAAQGIARRRDRLHEAIPARPCR